MGITLVCGTALVAVFRHEKTETMSQREGMAIVSLGWTAIGLFGALPFYFSDAVLFLCGCVLRVRFRVYHHRFIDSDRYRRLEPGTVRLAQFHPVAGGHGHHRPVHCHPSLFGCRRHAALQGRSAQSRAGQAQTPHPRYGIDPVESIRPVHRGRNAVADDRRHDLFRCLEPCLHHHAHGWLFNEKRVGGPF